MCAPAQVLALEEQRRIAMLAGDVPALRQLFAPDLRYVHSSGVADSGDRLLAKLAAGQLVYAQLGFEQLAVTATADAGLVSGVLRGEVLRSGAVARIAASYLAVWLRREGAWQLTAFQGTALPATA
jgi:hypothetical protein